MNLRRAQSQITDRTWEDAKQRIGSMSKLLVILVLSSQLVACADGAVVENVFRFFS